VNKRLFDSALNELSNHNYSEKELRLVLAKEFASLEKVEEQIEETFKRLRELHLLNDARLAENLAYRYSQKGNRLITQTLRHKGIGQAVIEQTLASLGEEKNRAIEAARKRMRSLSNEEPRATEIKLLRFLSCRGFSADALKQAIQYLKDDEWFDD